MRRKREGRERGEERESEGGGEWLRAGAMADTTAVDGLDHRRSDTANTSGGGDTLKSIQGVCLGGSFCRRQ